jgi:hypothetical protein
VLNSTKRVGEFNSKFVGLNSNNESKSLKAMHFKRDFVNAKFVAFKFHLDIFNWSIDDEK